MEGEQEAVAAVEPEAPAIEQEAVSEPVSLETPEAPEIEAEPEEDLEEFDWNGRKVRGPKGLKDGVLMNADYTRKTQEVAATKRELEQRAKQLDQQFQVSEDYLDARAELRGVERELKRFENFGWADFQQLRQTDPMGAQEAWDYVQYLHGQRQSLTARMSEIENVRSSETQQEIAKRMNETQQFAREKIPGWTPETDKQVVEFALAEGIDAQTLAGVMNPTVYKILHAARIGLQTLSKPAASAKPATPQPAPLQVVGAKSNAPARKSLADMSMEEYVAARKAGRRG